MATNANSTRTSTRSLSIESAFELTIEKHWAGLETMDRCGLYKLNEKQRSYRDGLAQLRKDRPKDAESNPPQIVEAGRLICANCLVSEICPGRTKH